MFFNGWKNVGNKKADRFMFKLRVSVVTLLEIYYDKGARHIRIILFNLGWKNTDGWKRR